MAELELSREEQLIAFFVNTCVGPVGRTRLMKLLYMADYEARRYLGHPVSTYQYIWYHHGPFDSDLYPLLDRLEEKGLIEHRPVRYPSGEGHLYSSKAPPPAFELSADEVEILSFVCREYSKVPLSELLDDIVYQTEPMLAAKEKNAKNEKLDMDVVNNSKSNEFSVPYAELLARSRRVRVGIVVSHAEAIKRLSSSAANAAA